jgi:hypothetical protein
MNCLSWLLSPPHIAITMITIVVVEKLNYNDLDLNSLKKSKWKDIGIKTYSNVVMDNIIVVDSIVRIIGMSLL